MNKAGATLYEALRKAHFNRPATPMVLLAARAPRHAIFTALSSIPFT